jgi:hypothetical protein
VTVGPTTAWISVIWTLYVSSLVSSACLFSSISSRSTPAAGSAASRSSRSGKVKGARRGRAASGAARPGRRRAPGRAPARGGRAPPGGAGRRAPRRGLACRGVPGHELLEQRASSLAGAGPSPPAGSRPAGASMMVGGMGLWRSRAGGRGGGGAGSAAASGVLGWAPAGRAPARAGGVRPVARRGGRSARGVPTTRGGAPPWPRATARRSARGPGRGASKRSSVSCMSRSMKRRPVTASITNSRMSDPTGPSTCFIHPASPRPTSPLQLVRVVPWRRRRTTR